MCNTTTPVAAPVPGGEKSQPPLSPHCYITLHPIASDPAPAQPLTPSEAMREVKSLLALSLPIALMSLLLYSRSVVSMLFLGSLGDLPLAAGSLAIAFANITGYSVLSGLSLGMEPLCSQAFGANQPKLLALTLRRSVVFLLACSLPILILWLHMSPILLHLGQDREITALAQRYLLFSLPDLLSFSLIHPLRIYLRSQGITSPLTHAAALAAVLHVSANLVLVKLLHLGVPGVAAASAASNLALLLFLLLLLPRLDSSFTYRECLSGWGPLARLAAPSCVSVCLEWWWYELMIILCGLLPDPKPAIASMGVLIQTTALVYVFPSSLGLGVSTRVGNELGANRPARARASAAVSVVMAAAMGFAAMAFATAVRGDWGRMFTEQEEILRLTAAALPILGLCELGNCPQTVMCGVLRGSARPTHAANVNLGAFYLVGLPVAVGLAFSVGVGFCGLWMGLLAAQVSCAGLMLYVVWTTDWADMARRAQLLTCSKPAGEEEGRLLQAEAALKELRFEQPEATLKELRFEPCISITMADLNR